MVKVKQHDERSHYECFSEFDFDVKRENGGLRKAEEEVVSIVHVRLTYIERAIHIG